MTTKKPGVHPDRPGAQIHVKLDRALLRRLRRRARAEHRTVTATVVMLIERYLATPRKGGA